MNFITHIMYSQLKQGIDDIYISKYLNLDLFKDLYPYEDVDNYENADFQKKHRLLYFGELLERYEERGIVKDIKDLRTLVFVAVNILMEGVPVFNADQDRDFAYSIIDKLDKEFDYFTAATILQLSSRYISKDFMTLIEKIVRTIESNKVDFEMAVYGIYSCALGLSTCMGRHDVQFHRELIFRLAGLLQDIELVPYSKNNLNDYSTYMLLSEACYEFCNWVDSNHFKNKKTFRYIRSMKHMQEKVIGHDVSMNTARQNLGMSTTMIQFLNYFTIKKIGDRAYLSDNKAIRLKLGLWNWLNEEYEIPEFIWDEIKDNISEQTLYDRYSYNTEPHNVSTIIAGNVSRVNFRKILTIEQELDFYRKGWIKYFLEDNLDLFELLSQKSKEEVITKALDVSEDSTDVKKYIQMLEQLGIDKTLVTDYSLGSKILAIEEDLDVIKALGRKNARLLEEVLKKIKCNYSFDDYVDYLLEYCNNGADFDTIIINTIGSWVQSTQHMDNFIINEITTLKLSEIKNIELKRRAQELRDKIIMLGLSRDNDEYFMESYYYILCNLKDVNYLTLMNISQEDKLEILNYLKDSFNTFLENGDERFSELAEDISILIAKEITNKDLDIDKCRSFIQEIRKSEEVSVDQKVKIDSVAKYIVNNDNTTLKDLRSFLIEIGEKNRRGFLDDSDLLQILKNGLLQVNN